MQRSRSYVETLTAHFLSRLLKGQVGKGNIRSQWWQLITKKIVQDHLSSTWTNNIRNHLNQPRWNNLLLRSWRIPAFGQGNLWGTKTQMIGAINKFLTTWTAYKKNIQLRLPPPGRKTLMTYNHHHQDKVRVLSNHRQSLKTEMFDQCQTSLPKLM